MNDTPRERQLITASRLAAFRRCPRLHRIRYVDRVRPVEEAGTLRFGTLVHRALEAWWRRMQDAAAEWRRNGDADGPFAPDGAWHAQVVPSPLDAALAALDLAVREIPPPGADPLAEGAELVRAQEMLRAYDYQWRHAMLEPIAVEAEFSAPLVNPATGARSQTFDLAGKLDVLCRRWHEEDPYSEVVLVEHKCLAADARLLDLTTGTYRTAGELATAETGPRVLALDGDRFVPTSAYVPRFAGRRPIYTIRTIAGRALRVSDNHPLWTPRGWVAAADLTAADWVATPKHLCTDVSDEDHSDEALRLIGYMIGDGTMSTLTFTKTDEAVLADVVRCAAAIGEEVVIARPVDRAPYIHFSMAREGRYGYVGRVLGLMRDAHLLDETAAAKRMPLHWALSDRQFGQVVGAMWSTDGCVDTDGKKLRIIYTSRSRGLCDDLRDALQRLGIVSRVRTTSVEYDGERRAVSTTQVVSRESKRRFLALAIEGVIPILRSAVPLAEAEQYIPDSKQGTDDRMQPRMDAHIWWDRVESVEVGAHEPTYDLTVPGLATFVVEGILTHNTTSEDVGPGSPYRRRLRMDGQVSVYHDGARAFGHEVAACVYDILVKPRIRPQRATPADARKYTKDGRLYANQRDRDETLDEYRERVRAVVTGSPADYLLREDVVRLAAELEDARADVWDTARTIRESELAGRWPRNPAACQAYGRDCDYWDHCSSGVSLDDPTRFARGERAHPELGGDAGPATTEEV